MELRSDHRWTATIGRDPDLWSFTLPRIDVQAALRLLGEHDSAENIGARAPSLRTLAADPSIYDRIEAALMDGPGFARVRRVPLDELTYRAAKLLHLLFAKSFGMLRQQDRMGSMVLDVMDPGDVIDPRDRHNPGRRWNDLPCHTDGAFSVSPPRLISLMSVSEALRGGAVRLMSAATILARAAGSTARMRALRMPVPFRSAHQLEPDDAVLHAAPIATGNGDALSFRFLRYQSDLSTASPALRRAVERIDALTRDRSLAIELHMEAGDILLINNARVLHGRQAFENKPPPAGPRHQMRLWLH